MRKTARKTPVLFKKLPPQTTTKALPKTFSEKMGKRREGKGKEAPERRKNQPTKQRTPLPPPAASPAASRAASRRNHLAQRVAMQLRSTRHKAARSKTSVKNEEWVKKRGKPKAKKETLVFCKKTHPQPQPKLLLASPETPVPQHYGEEAPPKWVQDIRPYPVRLWQDHRSGARTVPPDHQERSLF